MGTLVLASAASAQTTPMGTQFTYQGQISKDGSPFTGNCGFLFEVYDASTSGTKIGDTLSRSPVNVSKGFFTVTLDFGAVFHGEARWLDIQAGCPSGSSYVRLDPRQNIMATPFALALPGLHTEMNGTSPNVIGGNSGNSITSGVVGGTISGGGRMDSPPSAPGTNRVTYDFGTIGGGLGNWAGGRIAATVSGGAHNKASEHSATVGGGLGNTASGVYATVGGGSVNRANNNAATVSGGQLNTANNGAATVGGGYKNEANGTYSTVPGGSDNVAQGDYSFAAGRRAKASNQGTFVWSDSTDADFSSTGANQFLIRANGGVGIGTNSPGNLLTVNGNASFGGTAATDVPLEIQGSTAGISLYDRTGGKAERWVIYSNETGAPGTQHLRIWNDMVGNMGDKLSLSPAGNLYLAGCLNATNLICTSDARLKTGITGMSYGLQQLKQLRPVTWKWKDPSRKELPMGLVAQEVEEVIPELIIRGGESNTPLGLNYVGLVPVMIKAIQEQQMQVDTLHRELKDRDEKLAVLEARLAELEQALKRTSPIAEQ